MSAPNRALARLPLTELQRLCLWNADADGRDDCNLWVLRRVVGRLDRGALQQALDQLVQRHEALRTTFRRVGESFEQIVWERGTWPVEHVDLRSDSREPIAHVREFVHAVVPIFDAPLVAARVFELPRSEWIVALRVHHVVTDGWSCGILQAELDRLYLDAAAGRPPSLPPVRASFGDFLALGRVPPDPAKLAYWRRTFDTTPASTAERVADALDEPYRHVMLPTPPISLATAQGLRRIAAAARVSCETAMLAVGLTASLGMGGEELRVILVRANRDRPELRNVVGFIADYLPVRIPVGGDPSFAELISRTQRAWLTSLVNAVPLGELANVAGISTWPLHPVADLAFNHFTAKPPSASAPQQDADVPPLGEPGSFGDSIWRRDSDRVGREQPGACGSRRPSTAASTWCAGPRSGRRACSPPRSCRSASRCC